MEECAEQENREIRIHPPQIVIHNETLLAHLLLCLADCSVEHGTGRVRGDSHPNWVPPPTLSQSISAQWWSMPCNAAILLRYHNAVESSAPLLFSLKDSPPDGLSHTLWRPGGERGGESKKGGKLSQEEKDKNCSASLIRFYRGCLNITIVLLFATEWTDDVISVKLLFTLP